MKESAIFTAASWLRFSARHAPAVDSCALILVNLCEASMSQSEIFNPAFNSVPGAASDARFAFLKSAWHADIVDEGRDAFLAEMSQRGIGPDSIDTFEVPGAFEIPLHAQKLAQSGRYCSIVCCGLVVDGGIYRHEFVADAVIAALMAIQLKTGVPVFSAVLTPQRFHEHEEHRQFFTAHFQVKGKEVARACVETLASLKKLQALAA
jgi:6,7-dimethyl-8-ribityllumazine synthase